MKPNLPKSDISKTTPIDLSRTLAVACEIAKSAGSILNGMRSQFQVREKSEKDLVTDADDAAQVEIARALHEAFPDHGFLEIGRAHV